MCIEAGWRVSVEMVESLGNKSYVGRIPGTLMRD